jgi:hypothetical protein
LKKDGLILNTCAVLYPTPQPISMRIDVPLARLAIYFAISSGVASERVILEMYSKGGLSF